MSQNPITERQENGQEINDGGNVVNSAGQDACNVNALNNVAVVAGGGGSSGRTDETVPQQTLQPPPAGLPFVPHPSAVASFQLWSQQQQQPASQPPANGGIMAPSIPPGVAQTLQAAMFASMVQSQMARLRNHFATNQPQQQQQQQQQFPFNQQQQFLQQQLQQQQQQSSIHQQQNNATSHHASRQPPQSTLPTSASATMPEPDSRITTGISKVLALDQDYREISPYQCLVRENIELFEQPENYQESKQGRNRPVVPGQVGIRCRHCGTRPQFHTRGSMLFPTTLLGLYQTAQNLANTHLLKTCLLIPDETRRELVRVRSREAGKKTRKSSYGGGRHYWAASLGVLGVIETPDRGLAFKSSSTGSNGESKSDTKNIESESENCQQ